jgi:hypothetical protein
MTLLELVGYVKRGANRLKVFNALDKPALPSELTRKIYGKTSNTYFNIVSRSLGELKEKKLIEIINPKDKTGRMYQRTLIGKKVSEKLKELS